MGVRVRMPSKSAVFAVLMLAAVLAALLPSWCTRWMRAIVQPLGWLQYGASSGTSEVVAALEAVGEAGLSPEEAAGLRSQNEELKRKLGHQSLLLEELRQRFVDVQGLRDELDDASAKIIIARVVARDTEPARETLTIGKGSFHGIKQGQWVTTGVVPGVGRAGETGRELLARQCLVGRVAEVWPYLSRVQLVTDARFGPVYVRAARELADGTWQQAPDECLLAGLGNGRMRISRAPVDFYESGFRIALLPTSEELPVPMAVGEIVAARKLDEAPLYYDLDVLSWADFGGLSHVYVIAASP